MDTFGGVCCLSSSEGIVAVAGRRTDICSHRYGLADDDLCGLELEQFHTEMFVSLALGMEREFVTVILSLGFYIHIGYYYADAGRILPVGMIEKLCGS